MQSFMRSIGLVSRQNVKLVESRLTKSYYLVAGTFGMSSFDSCSRNLVGVAGGGGFGSSDYISHMKTDLQTACYRCPPSATHMKKILTSSVFQQATSVDTFTRKGMTTMGSPVEAGPPRSSLSAADIPTRIKFKRLDKTAGHIMQILDKEAVAEVREQREIPEIKPGYIIQLKVVVPENKRRVSTIKGIVIARRNAGLNSTFRLRRLVAGVGVESLFPLYSPNIKEIKIVDKKKVRRAKLYYLRDKMNALKKH